MQRRPQRLGSTIHRLAAEAIHAMDLPGEVAVTSVRVSSDLRYADIWIAALAADDEAVLATVQSQQGGIRSLIAARTRVRKVPTLNIHLDRSSQRRQRINELADET